MWKHCQQGNLQLGAFYVSVKLRKGKFPALVVSSDTGRRKAGQDILKPGEADTCAASAHQLQSSHARQPQHSDTCKLMWLVTFSAFQCLCLSTQKYFYIICCQKLIVFTINRCGCGLIADILCSQCDTSHYSPLSHLMMCCLTCWGCRGCLYLAPVRGSDRGSRR